MTKKLSQIDLDKVTAILESGSGTTFQPIDFTLKSIADLIDSGKITLNPKFQRRITWDVERKSKLIESFLLNVPIPPVYIIRLKKNGEGLNSSYTVIDGQQRLNAVYSFFNNEYRLKGLETTPQLNGYNYSDLKTTDFIDLLSTRPLRTYEVVSSNPKTVFDIFSRLNTGGMVLNDQEIRNSIYSDSKFNDLIKELSSNPYLKEMMQISNKKTERMWDCELVLRYFSMIDDGYKNFRHDFKTFLNLTMEKYAEISDNDAKSMKDDFDSTIKLIYDVLGKKAFTNQNGKLSNNMYDAICHSFHELRKNNEVTNYDLNEISNSISELWEKAEFRDLFSKGTNTNTKLEKRIKMVDDAVKSAVMK